MFWLKTVVYSIILVVLCYHSVSSSNQKQTTQCLSFHRDKLKIKEFISLLQEMQHILILFLSIFPQLLNPHNPILKQKWSDRNLVKVSEEEKKKVFAQLEFEALNLFVFFRGQKKIKIQFSSIDLMFTNTMETQQPQTPLIIGYYPVRAKAQLCRLLCQYLHIPYVDQLLNPNQWDQFKRTTAKDWIIKELPFLIDGNFVVTGCTGCSYYVVQKSGRLDLFGRTLQDNIKITAFGNRKDLHGAVLGLICKLKTNRTPEQLKQLKHYWTSKIEPILQTHQKEAKEDNWYLGYISLLDFTIYLVINQLNYTFPEEILKYKKLVALRQKVYNIPQIYAYENSARAVKCFNPVEYFNSFKEEMMKKIPNSQQIFNSSKYMDLQ